VRLTLPTRVPLPHAFVFASLFFCVQQFEHTNFFFSMLYFAFLILSVIAFNLAEGFSRITGAYIFWYATLIVIVGVTWKAVVGEPADSNLYTPVLDMSLYAASMVMLILVALLNKKMDYRSLGIGGGLSGANLNYSSAGLGCLIVGYMILFADSIFGQAPGGIISALIQVNMFGPLGIILATIGAIQNSGGRRATDASSLIGIIFYSYTGFTAFSKQQMLTPMVCFLVGAFYARLKLRFVHYVAFAFMAWLSFGFISPLSASRDLAEGLDTEGRVALIFHLATHWTEFKEHVQGQEIESVNGYYNSDQGSLIERLSMIAPDDSLFAYTEQGHYEGIEPVVEYFENLAPHFLAPNKSVKYSGNYYDHEMGRGLAADDFSTGISFSPVGEAYHCEGWGGIFWLLPLLWLMLFTTVDFVVGDMTKYPWGLMVIVWFAHAAPETLLGGMIWFMGLGNFGMFMAIIVVTRFAPIVGTLFGGKPTSAPPTRSIGRVVSVMPQHQG
jgi:hypothetical protein